MPRRAARGAAGGDRSPGAARRFAALSLLLFGRGAFAQAEPQVFFSQVYGHNPAQAREDPESIDRKMAAFIDAATVSLDAALFEVHNERIATAIRAAHRRGV